MFSLEIFLLYCKWQWIFSDKGNGKCYTDCLCNYRRKRCSRCLHVKYTDKQQIENNIDNTCNQYKQKWRAGISDSTENTADSIVGCDKDHSARTDADIANCFIHCFCRNIHQFCRLRSKQDHKRCHKNCKQRKQFNLSCYDITGFFRFLCSHCFSQKHCNTHS